MKQAIKLRIIFMGTPLFAKEILEALIKNSYNIIAVFTQPDLPQGRKQEIVKSPVKILAETNQIPVYQPASLNDEVAEEIKKLKPDIIIVAAYGKILPPKILNIPGFGCINVHASLLPKFRGPSPIQNALLAGMKETGITIFLMNQGIDTGDILAQEKIKINPDDTAQSLSQKLSFLGAELLLKTLPPWVERKITPQKQDDSKTSLCQLIEREDGHIIWEEEAEKIYNKFRAFYPWPGIFGFWKNNDTLERLKFIKIKLENENSSAVTRSAGEVFKIGDEVAVQTMKGAIILEEIQPEGKKPMTAKDFIIGHPNFIGSVLE